VVAGSQTTDLLAELQADPARMRATLESASGTDAEQQQMAALVGGTPSASYLGATDRIIDAVLARARSSRTHLALPEATPEERP
jgi:3-carboxy-cis,cis-muconate cycloisomerase